MTLLQPAIALVGLTLAGTALALPTTADLQRAFDQLDHNRDQLIGQVEWDQHAFALFRAADTDRDNRLSPAEIEAGPGHSETVNKFDLNRDGLLELDEFIDLRRKLFVTADINGDDRVNRVEFELYQLIAEVGWEDADGNGRLNFTELRASLAKVFQLADTDHDGVLTEAEASFLSSISYDAATAKGDLDAARFYAYYRWHLTGD
ncbi:MAG: hypothetical protein IT582_10415 [Opitutaceae bacterium]|nr:hypothetical protein [Opitutaceae bacterium]